MDLQISILSLMETFVYCTTSYLFLCSELYCRFLDSGSIGAAHQQISNETPGNSKVNILKAAHIKYFFVYFFGGLECVGHSFAYVAHFCISEICLESNPEFCRSIY
jgi:hypothetical protein